MRRILRYAAMMLIIPSVLTGESPQEEVRKRQSELQAIRDQILEFEGRIRQQQKNEEATLDLLDSYDKKGTLLRRLIKKLRREEDELKQKIRATQTSLGELESRLRFLKNHYRKYVTSVYKAGRTYDLELLLSSRSINQLYVRNQYLQRFTAQRRSDVEKIRQQTRELEEVHARAQQQLTEERRLIAEKGAEEDRLAALAEDRRGVLKQIRSDRKLLRGELERKVKAAKDLEAIIARLIEADRIRREREAAAGGPTTEEPVSSERGFAARKGRLRWPVSEGLVVARFGNQRHPTLQTVTHNTGIDISVKSGTPVVAVADGDVATIWWLPSYGNLVILSHANGFRTVYTHLAEIFVTEGQQVSEGERIGESGESLDGPRLHFEVWKDREKQNPELWLTQR